MTKHKNLETTKSLHDNRIGAFNLVILLYSDMVSDEEKLRREIRIVREAIAQTEKRNQIGFSSWWELEQDITIPNRWRHLKDQTQDELEEHLRRLERDLADAENLDPDSLDGISAYYNADRTDYEE